MSVLPKTARLYAFEPRFYMHYDRNSPMAYVIPQILKLRVATHVSPSLSYSLFIYNLPRVVVPGNWYRSSLGRRELN